MVGPPTQTTGGYTGYTALATWGSWLGAHLNNLLRPTRCVELIKLREKRSFIDNKSFLSELSQLFIVWKLMINCELINWLIKLSERIYSPGWWCCTELSDSVLVILCTTNTSIIREKAHSDGIQSKWEKSSSRPLQMQLVQSEIFSISVAIKRLFSLFPALKLLLQFRLERLDSSLEY